MDRAAMYEEATRLIRIANGLVMSSAAKTTTDNWLQQGDIFSPQWRAVPADLSEAVQLVRLAWALSDSTEVKTAAQNWIDKYYANAK